MAKKRPTLDAFLTAETGTGETIEENSGISDSTALLLSPAKINSTDKKFSGGLSKLPEKSKKHEVIRHMLYLPLPVYDQLQSLVFEEQQGQTKRRKTHDYLLDAIDLLFKKKGLKSIQDLVKKNP